jgi:hypothetical protein
MEANWGSGGKDAMFSELRPKLDVPKLDVPKRAPTLPAVRADAAVHAGRGALRFSGASVDAGGARQSTGRTLNSLAVSVAALPGGRGVAGDATGPTVAGPNATPASAPRTRSPITVTMLEISHLRLLRCLASLKRSCVLIVSSPAGS